MTNPLLGVLFPQPAARLAKAVITSVQATEKAVTVTYLGGLVAHVGYLASYTPTVGDIVVMLIQDGFGMIVIGRQDVGTQAALPTPAAVSTVAPTAANTYNTDTATWTGEQIAQSPVKSGAWFYSAAAFTALAGLSLAQFEIQVTPAAGSEALRFVLHTVVSTADPFQTASSSELLKVVPTGVASWVSLPVSWVSALISGSAKGIGLQSGLYSAVVSGGTLRFTPL